MVKKAILLTLIILLSLWFYNYENFWPITGWIALFLFWMSLLGGGFRELTGGGFEKILKKLTDKTWKSMTLWAFWAAIMQSSSLVTIIAISFLSAELIPLAQGIAISIGSNIWTTSWAWIMAQLWEKAGGLSAYAMPIIVFWLLFLIQKTKNFKWIWNILIWIWIVFIWVWYIQDWFEALSKAINFKEYAISGFKWVLVFTWIWIILTILLQSSHASILIILTAMWAWQLTLENALALTIWANIWTTVTAILWAFSSNINWKRLAIADVIFKWATWVVFVIFIYQVIPFVEYISNILNLSNPAFDVAIFHTLFNVTWTIIFMSFYGKYIKFVEKIVPEKEIINSNIDKNIYLKEANLEFPSTAISALVKETKHMYENSIFVILKVFWIEQKDIEWNIDLEDLRKKVKIFDVDINQLYNEKIKILFGEIMNFASRATWLPNLKEKDFNDFTSIKKANSSISESVKILKHMQRNLKIFIDSDNPEIKKEYENIILDIIFTLQRTKDLDLVTKNEEKIKIIATIEKYLKENDIINNWTLDNLIRNWIITNEMATSLIKDTNYKNDICRRLIISSERVFNKEIYDEIQEVNEIKEEIKNPETSEKKEKKLKKEKKEKWFGKIMHKFKKRRIKLLEKLYETTDETEKEKIKEEIEKIDFILEKYQE